jgi:hypothetical protein
MVYKLPPAEGNKFKGGPIMNKYIRLEARKRLAAEMQISVEQAEDILVKMALEVRGNSNGSSKN